MDEFTYRTYAPYPFDPVEVQRNFNALNRHIEAWFRDSERSETEKRHKQEVEEARQAVPNAPEAREQIAKLRKRVDDAREVAKTLSEAFAALKTNGQFLGSTVARELKTAREQAWANVHEHETALETALRFANTIGLKDENGEDY